MQERDDWHLTDDIKHEAGSGDPFAAAVRGTRMPMVITDPSKPDNPIVFCNEAFQQLTGYSRPEIIGRNCRFLQGPDTDPETVRMIREAIAAGQNIDIELLNYRKDGSTFWNALYLSPVRGEAGGIQFFFASQLDVTERVERVSRIAAEKVEVEREIERRTADLEAALKSMTLLLHEVDHRVKNNLTMIGSLLRLQARSIGDPVIASKLESMLERVDALATVHRRLYQSDDITRFDVGALAQNLVSDIVGASGQAGITTSVDVERVDLPSSKAAALGLVMNEILTNAMKHAFSEGQGGTLGVSVRSHDERVRIVIADSGPGLGDAVPGESGLGGKLIKRLSRQIGASVDWEDAAPGTRVVISFPLEAV